MCVNTIPSTRMFSSSTITNTKRKVSIDTIMPKTESPSSSSFHRQYKRPRISSSSVASTEKKSVQFHPEVKLRCVLPSSNNNPQDATWIDPFELCEMKASARNLAKAHLIRTLVHSRDNATATSTATSTTLSPSTIHPARYEIQGESLRGMEHITDLSMGKSRRLSRDTAIKSVNQEQCRQVLIHALTICHGDVSLLNTIQFDVEGFKVDRTELARVYGEKTKDALAYSRRLAEEDAKMAAEILSQDL